MDYNTGYQYSVTGSGVTPNGNLSPGTGDVNVTINGVTSSWTGATSKPTFTQTTPGANFQFTETYSRTWFKQPYNYRKSDRGYKRNRHYKYIPAVIAALIASPVNAETIGGVSATAETPIANSSGLSDQSSLFRFYKAHISLTHTEEVFSVRDQLEILLLCNWYCICTKTLGTIF